MIESLEGKLPGMDSDRLQVQAHDEHGAVSLDGRTIYCKRFEPVRLSEDRIYQNFVDHCRDVVAAPLHVTGQCWYKPQLYQLIHSKDAPTVFLALVAPEGKLLVEQGRLMGDHWVYQVGDQWVSIIDSQYSIESWAYLPQHPLREDGISHA